MGPGYVVAAAVGIGIAIQLAVIGRTTDSVNPLAQSLALQVSGVAVAAIWATSQGAWTEVVIVARNWWWVPLGAGGWAVVAALGFASNRIGIAPTVAMSVAAQLVVGLGIDTTAGSTHPNAVTTLGLALILGGVTLVVTHS